MESVCTHGALLILFCYPLNSASCWSDCNIFKSILFGLVAVPVSLLSLGLASKSCTSIQLTDQELHGPDIESN